MTFTQIHQGINLLQVSQNTCYFYPITDPASGLILQKKLNAISFEPLLSYLLSLEMWFESSCFSSCVKHICVGTPSGEKDLRKGLTFSLLRRALCWHHSLSPLPLASPRPAQHASWTHNLFNCFLASLYLHFNPTFHVFSINPSSYLFFLQILPIFSKSRGPCGIQN